MTKEKLNEYGMKITQANATELVSLTLKIAGEYINDAMETKKDAENFRNSIKKARNCVGQLISSLDMKYKISAELLRLYRFINIELEKASIRNDDANLSRIKGITDKLANSFDDISKEDKGGQMMQNTQQVYVGLTYSKSSLNENIYSDANRGYTV